MISQHTMTELQIHEALIDRNRKQLIAPNIGVTVYGRDEMQDWTKVETAHWDAINDQLSQADGSLPSDTIYVDVPSDIAYNEQTHESPSVQLTKALGRVARKYFGLDLLHVDSEKAIQTERASSRKLLDHAKHATLGYTVFTRERTLNVQEQEVIGRVIATARESGLFTVVLEPPVAAINEQAVELSKLL